jgi:adenylylsulfate reductase, subunit B
VLGVLLLREGLSAERHRCARLCRLRPPGAKATISWKLKFRDGREKNFESPIRTTPWGSIKGPAEYDAPRPEDFARQELAHEPEALKISGGLPALRPEQLKPGVV